MVGDGGDTGSNTFWDSVENKKRMESGSIFGGIYVNQTGTSALSVVGSIHGSRVHKTSLLLAG